MVTTVFVQQHANCKAGQTLSKCTLIWLIFCCWVRYNLMVRCDKKREKGRKGENGIETWEGHYFERTTNLVLYSYFYKLAQNTSQDVQYIIAYLSETEVKSSVDLSMLWSMGRSFLNLSCFSLRPHRHVLVCSVTSVISLSLHTSTAVRILWYVCSISSSLCQGVRRRVIFWYVCSISSNLCQGASRGEGEGLIFYSVCSISSSLCQGYGPMASLHAQA